MSRYALELAYNGAAYAGWQRQPNAVSVEQTAEAALATILGTDLRIVGCGRTDTGVHASYYVAHFDYDGELPPRLLGRYNRFVADDIVALGLYAVGPDFHARFHARSRSYVYQLTFVKDPFRPQTVTSLPQYRDRLDPRLMQQAAALLTEYSAFAPFCRTNSDAFTMNCDLTHAAWTFGTDEWRFDVSANRFLRGMVRLMVGMCVRVGEGKLSLDEVRRALDEQRRLPKPWSAPANGLYLSAVEYPNKSDWTRLY